MAGFPPPFPAPPDAPYGFNLRQQKRLYKQQIRAQEVIRRSQQRLQQQHLRSLRRNSLLTPVMIVVAGLFLLLIRTGHLSALFLEAHFNQWWPLALLLAGTVLGLEWIYDQRSLANGSPYIRRGAGGGITLLAALLIGTSAYLNGVNGDHALRLHGFGITPDNLAEVFGEKHERDEQLNLPVPRGTALSFTNPHGDITIIGSSNDDRIHIQINKQVFSNSDADVDKKADQLSPKITWENGVMLLVEPQLNGAEADLTISVPDSSPVSTSANNGDIHITGTHGPVSVTQEHGDVELNEITGAVVAHMNNNGSSFSASNIVGDLILKGHAQDLSLNQISGQVTLEGDFYGDTHLEHLGGPVEFRTKRTQFAVSRLEGQIDISPDEDFIANQLVGPTTLSTRSRNISLDRITGDLTVANSNGTVDITGAAPLTEIRVQNRNGAVNLTVPDRSGFILEAEAQDGEVSNDFNLSSTKTGNRDSLRATVGDGRGHIELSTSHAGIILHKGDVQAPAPLPLPPIPPATRPVKTTRF